MKAIILIALVYTILGCSNCQLVPSAAEIEEILNDPNKVTETVDCVIKFDPATCDPRIQEAYDLAPEYFSTGGNCRTCSPKDLQEVKKFLQKLQNRYRKEYQRLVSSVAA